MDNIERLYKCYEILSEAGDKITEVSAIKKRVKMNGSCQCTRICVCVYTFAIRAGAS